MVLLPRQCPAGRRVSASAGSVHPMQPTAQARPSSRPRARRPLRVGRQWQQHARCGVVDPVRRQRGGTRRPDGLLWSGTGRVELGRDFALALDETSTLVAVGRNLEGQLGNGSTNASSTLVDVWTLTAVSSFSVGQTSAAAITNGQLWAWGWNGSAAVTTPTRVGSGTRVHHGVRRRHPFVGHRPRWRDLLVGRFVVRRTGSKRGAAGTPAVVMRP